MIFSQHYLACLSHASYFVGDERTGRAVVIDPRRDIDVYLDEATSRGMTIERVIETHIHADFLSGHLELAAATGAAISFGEGASVEFPIEPLADGRRISLGEVTLEVLATPGHTPESICIAVYEQSGDEVPYGVLTGDTLFVGDVGRPDLLAAGGTGLSADALGRLLYRSLHGKLLTLPDATRVFPAHGAGSSCGKKLSSETSSTIGEQRRTNYALAPMSEDEFVDVVTEGQSTAPAYFAFDSARNRQLRPLADAGPPADLELADVLARQAAGAVLLDTREPAEFAAGHLRGAITTGLQGRFAEWAADVLTPDQDVVLVGDPESAQEAKMRLARVGYDRVVGRLADTVAAYRSRPDLLEASSRVTIEALAELRGLEPNLQLVDVRGSGETAAGTLPGARETPLAVLRDALDGLDPAAPVVVYCGSGYRSIVAASMLTAAGFPDVSDLLGGYGAWDSAGMPTAAPGSGEQVDSTPQLGVRAAQAAIAGGAVLLDVREPAEWAGGHVAGATLIPMGEVARRRAELPTEGRIVVVCRSGGRSAAVTASLRAAGLDAVNLAGGMCAWSAAGLSVTAEPSEEGLVVHGRNPMNCETSLPALIGGVVMPNARFYVRNHFPIPQLDPATWTLRLHGLVERPLELSLRDLHNMRSQTTVATLECAGNGRSALDPPVPGEQWRLGAVSTAEWTGVPLREVLDRAGIADGATEVLMRGADSGCVADRPEQIRFERSLTLDEVRTYDPLLAYAMNGEPLPAAHGYPLRVIVPRWYAVTSVKWLTEIELIDHQFRGFFHSERYFFEWERPDGVVREPARLQQVRALITAPTPGAELPAGDLVVRGVAWSGAAPIDRVEVSIGDGAWQHAQLIGQRPQHSWQWWELLTRVEQPGPVSIRARATDLAGRSQPDQPAWNRLGYGSNAIQTVELTLTGD